MWLRCEGAVDCARCCTMSAALALSSCNQGCGRCAFQLSERDHAPSSCLNINHKSLESSKDVVLEPCKRWHCPAGQWIQAGCRGKWSRCVGPWQAHLARCFSHSKTCTQCFHKSRTSFPHPEFCYELSMVCAMMASYVLESSECGSSGQFFLRARVCT
jgi:hypothetical protein